MSRTDLSPEGILGPRGVLAQRLPGFEFRREQLDMARAVADALADGTHCLTEAGTGVGKTFAYLIPALLHLNGKRKVVVSTHTIGLQEQLWHKDIPALRELLPSVRFRAALLKGMSNYVCLQNLEAAARLGLLIGEDFEAIYEWASQTATGDVAELPAVAAGWGEICASPESCRRQDCSYYDRCFLYQARRDAAVADVVVVNHALFFTDLALRAIEGAPTLLPDYDVAILDEAHHLEDVASTAYGIECSNFRVTSLVARLRHLRQSGVDPGELEALEAANRRLFEVLATVGRQEFFLEEAVETVGREELEEAGRSLATRLQETARHLTASARDVGDEMARARVEGYARTAARAADDLLAILFPAGENQIAWAEHAQAGRRVQMVLHLTPVRVSDFLQSTLWSRVPTVVLTSATLATGGSFSYLRGRLGVPQAREAIVGSPFDYQRQALLYVAAHLDPPSEDPRYQQSVVAEIRRILELTQGRAFVLFTSYRALDRAYRSLSEELPFPCLRQGDAPHAQLLAQFRATPGACLFGVQSFWEGVDVPGEALSCVIIDRLPFAVPDHPVHRARVQAIRDAGGDWFNDYVVPHAQIRLKQGFGRLIRTRTDTGIVCILDSRLARKAYGRSFLRSLPRCSVTTDLDEVASFLARVARTKKEPLAVPEA